MLLARYAVIAWIISTGISFAAVQPTVNLSAGQVQSEAVLRQTLEKHGGQRIVFPPDRKIIVNARIRLPDKTVIDLNGSEMIFIIKGAEKCLVLGSFCSVSNGRISCRGEKPAGSSDFHCPVVIGEYAANLGAGVHDVQLENLEITGNRLNGNGIIVVGDSHDIRISNISFPDCPNMGRPILVHWGNPDNLKWGTTHPHDVRISAIRAGRLGYDETPDVGVVAISGAFAISIEDVRAEGARNGIFVYAGDYGFKHARPGYGQLRGQEIKISTIRINNIRDKGIYILGKSSKREVYADMPVSLNSSHFSGTGAGNKGAGIYLNHVSGASISDTTVTEFNRGFFPGTGVSSVTASDCTFAGNSSEGVLITAGASHIHFLRCASYGNGFRASHKESSGFRVLDGKHITFENCSAGKEGVDESQAYGFRIEGTSKVAHIRMTSCVVYETGTGGKAFFSVRDPHFPNSSMKGGTTPEKAAVIDYVL